MTGKRPADGRPGDGRPADRRPTGAPQTATAQTAAPQSTAAPAGTGTPATDGSPGAQAPTESTWGTLRRGLALSPELRTGLAGTLVLALISMIGRAAVPVAVQQGIDRGLTVPGGPDLRVVGTVVLITAAVLVVTTACGYLMMRRLFTVSETALANVRIRAFRHVHDLSMLHQQSERRGSLVSRVTSDVDQITQFLQWGGVILLVNLGQLVVTTVVMAVYSWQLTLAVYLAFLPAVMIIRVLQNRLAGAYAQVRVRTGAMLTAVAESVVGAPVIRAYGVARRTAARLDETIDAQRQAQQRAIRISIYGSSVGELAAGVALAAVVVLGVWMGVGDRLTIGQLTAFLFLVTLFIQPVQIATEVLNEAQNAIAGWRRVLDVLDLEPDVADPGDDGVDLPPGPLDVRFVDVGFAYPTAGPDGRPVPGPPVLSDVSLHIPARTRVAVVGETGSGKTTFAKLLTRLMDPSTGEVLLAGAPLVRVRFGSLRSRVVMVPQDGFLFDSTVAGNVRFARPAMTDAELAAAFAELGLDDWVSGLPAGLDTPVGERGEALSVGERQLVALARAYVADPDLLVLDEATSAVDPATEVRLQRTLDAVTRGRTTVAIAHRLSTAQAADEVIVVDRGRVVQRGPHDDLVRDPSSVYGLLYASWLEQTR
ncbi:multidrug ABC transporter ATP-binding protein [Plantactinospora sp. KBS50]|nr:multidrug ABC transporter ATP-binding protein [Plantactinospora sp. KBS50]